MMYNTLFTDDTRNQYRYNFVNKETGKRSYFINYCYGNIYQQIKLYRQDLKKMCLVGISNDTHYIESVQDCTGKYIYINDNI